MRLTTRAPTGVTDRFRSGRDRPACGSHSNRAVARRLPRSCRRQGTGLHRLGRRVCRHQRRVHVEATSRNQSPLATEPNHPLEELPVPGWPEPLPGLGEHAVVGDRLAQLVAEEPAPGQIEPRLLTELALVPNVVQVAQQSQLEQHHRVHRRLPSATVERPDQPVE